MIKIGITGSLASGKTTASRILSFKRGPLFSADKVVKELYSNKRFKYLISKRFKIANNNRLKKAIKKIIFEKKTNIKKLEKIIHPIVRKKMKRFTLLHKNRKLLFYEIPLLIESKLMYFFDYIILVVSPRKYRLKRYLKNGGNKKMFYLLDKNQISAKKKVKYCDYLIVNNKSKNILKKRVSDIINNV